MGGALYHGTCIAIGGGLGEVMSVGGPEVCGPECVGLEVLDHPAALPAEEDHLNLQSYLLSWGDERCG